MNFKKLKDEKIEIGGFVLLIILLIGMPILILSFSPWNSSKEGYKTISLTAVAKDGVWTNEKVTNYNYWNTNFKAANLVFEKGEKVLLKLTSMDVTHTFYVPELNIGPIEVLPGHMYEITFEASKTGNFVYYCTTICGNCHFYMQGSITINSGTETSVKDSSLKKSDLIVCEHEQEDINTTSFISLGENLFNSNSCATCHGINGKGGVFNPNYINDFVPTLNDLAEKMKIYWKEDADIIIKLLEENVELEKLLDNPPISRYNRFFAQYESIFSKIINGTHKLQKKDTIGPEPPLYMPAWEYQLTKKDIDAIMAFLISQYAWEE